MRTLLHETPIALHADAFAESLLGEMLPAAREGAAGPLRASVRAIRSRAPAPPAPERRATLRMSGVSLWIDPAAPERAMFRNASGTVHGILDRATQRARLQVSPEIAEAERADPGVAFGIAIALLAARIGHAMIHGAAVVALDGRAWLLVGDSHSGKSSTTATLVSGGWDYLSDDAVILSPRAGALPVADIHVEGWRVPIRLDRGWPHNAPRADRVEIDPRSLGGGTWRASAPLGGLFFPQVDRAATTVLAPISRADAFAALVRQSPWLLADAVAAPVVTELLARASAYPSARLTLGADCHAGAERMTAILGAMTRG